MMDYGSGDYRIIAGDGTHRTVRHWNDIPSDVRAILKFCPDVPAGSNGDGSHTDEEHDFIDALPMVLDRFMEMVRNNERNYQDR